jgi:hypothetical protein
MRHVEFGSEVGENRNMGMWAGKNKKKRGWFHPVEWSKLMKK